MKKNTKTTKQTNQDESVKIVVDWGWQVEAMIYSLVANFILGVATLATIILRK
jgi:hypothetical protein